MTKVCSKCGQEKPISDFYRRHTAKDGRRGQCKKCFDGQKEAYLRSKGTTSSNRNKHYRKSNPEYFKKWRENNPDYFVKWRENNPEYHTSYARENRSKMNYLRKLWDARNKAHLKKISKASHLVRNHLKSIGIKYDRCSNCRAIGRIHLHHTDYSKPFVVAPLCQTCHMRVHSGRIEVVHTIDTLSLKPQDAPQSI